MYINKAIDDKDLILTRYLYFVDDVYNSLEQYIINRKKTRKIDEALFWVGELYYSGFEIWEFLFYMYYSYYYLDYSYIENKLIKNYNKYLKIEDESKKIELIIDTIKNILIKKPNKEVLQIVNRIKRLSKECGCHNDFFPYIENDVVERNLEYKTYRSNKKINNRLKQLKCDIDKIPKELKNFLLMIIKEDLYSNNAIDYIVQILINTKNNDTVLKNDNGIITIKSIYDICNTILGKNKLNFGICYTSYIKILKLIGMIIMVKNKYNGDEIINDNKPKFIKSTKKQIEYVIETNKGCEYLFDTLKEKRKFKIVNNIDGLQIKKIMKYFQKDLKEELTIGEKKNYIQRNGLWEYFIFGCPLWECRLKELDIVRNPDYVLKYDIEIEDYNLICCNDEVKKEKFYSLYDYELQEQPLKIIMNAL